MDWRAESEIGKLRLLLDEALDLLYEYGAFDPVQGEDNVAVREFLARADVREARL